MKKVLTIGAALLLAAPLPLMAADVEEARPAAQAEKSDQASPLLPGGRLRLHSRNGDTISGTLVSWSTGSILLLAGDLAEPRAIDPSVIQRVEVSIRRVSRTGQGALVGTLLGAAVPLLLGSIANARGGDVGGREVKDLTRVTLPAGALLGALIGSLAKKDVWETVDTATDHPVSMRVRLAPAPGRGVAAGVTLSWR